MEKRTGTNSPQGQRPQSACSTKPRSCCMWGQYLQRSPSMTDRPLTPSYTAAILRKLQHGAVTICRTVRKSLFKLGIWRPRHPPYPAGKHQTTSSPRPIPTLITNRTRVHGKLRDGTCTLFNLHTIPLPRWPKACRHQRPLPGAKV